MSDPLSQLEMCTFEVPYTGEELGAVEDYGYTMVHFDDVQCKVCLKEHGPSEVHLTPSNVAVSPSDHALTEVVMRRRLFVIDGAKVVVYLGREHCVRCGASIWYRSRCDQLGRLPVAG